MADNARASAPPVNVTPAVAPLRTPPAAVVATVSPPLAQPVTVEDGAPAFDDAAESAFLAEARDRGEPVRPTRLETDAAEESDPKALPPLDELVKKIPADVRETLEDLFRARFVSVRRVPKKALK